SPSTPRPLDRGRGVWHHPTPTPAPYARPGPHSKSGPSPRAWGLAKEGAPVCSMSRSIPTCVGLGTAPRAALAVVTVHPHVRGAWHVDPSTATIVSGPSPRAWGLACRSQHGHHRARSIPTCVGLGLKGPPEDHCRSVHPHARGAWASVRAIPRTALGPC